MHTYCYTYLTIQLLLRNAIKKTNCIVSTKRCHVAYLKKVELLIRITHSGLYFLYSIIYHDNYQN